MASRGFRTRYSSLRLRNFRCYKDSGTVELRPLTILVGPNNSGKSTLIDALLLLKQTLVGETAPEQLITSGTEVDLGGYFDILRGGRSAEDRTFQIEVESQFEGFNPERLTPSVAEDSSQAVGGSLKLSVTFDFDEDRGSPFVRSAKFDRDGRTVLGVVNDGKGPKLEGINAEVERELVTHTYSFIPYIHGPLDPTRPSSSKDAEAVVSTSTQVSSYWSNVFSAIEYIAPLRDEVPRIGVLGQTTPRHRGASGNQLLQLLKNREKLLGSQRTLLQEVNRWLAKNKDVLSRLRLKALDTSGTAFSLLGQERGAFPMVNVANMGQGISQLLPVVASLLGADYNDCVVVEQPEIHLHPALQASLADVFVSTVRGPIPHQVIVETHSEHILLRVRRRVADRTLNPKDVIVLYVERKRGETKVRQIEIDERGQLKDWPEGFFEEDFEEAYQLSRAASRRNN